MKIVNFLNENQIAIIDGWELQVRSQLSAPEGTSSLVLRNHLVKLLDELRGYLYELSLNGDFKIENSGYLQSAIGIFEKHGRERATTKDYVEDQLIWEVILLRRTIMESLNEHELVDSKNAERITRFFEAVSTVAVREFSEALKATQRKIISSLIHDIRNPLSTIQAACELLNRMDLPEEAKQLLHPMRYSGRRMGAILGEVLDSATIEAGKGLYLTFQQCDFRDDLEVLREESRSVYKDRFQYESTGMDKDISAVLDTAILVRLLENLISNGFKHGSPEGKVTLRVENHTDDIVISVHNEGEPIPRDKQEDIFSYLSTTKGGDAGRKSWGIGLALAKAAMEGHKGDIRLESTERNGTSFILTLPKHARKPGETVTVTV